ncbi:MAG: cytochrome c maturation protein CcmE [ANME-2 cluster archaeon]|nr:cytochrome c maturation protein CcmE [ANME-2 cluster archaeon]
MDKKIKRIAGFTIILVLVIYLAYTSFASSISFYYEVSDVKAHAESMYGTKVNVNGTVVPGSIHWDPEKVLLTFKLTDNVSTIDVVYSDAIPNNLADNTLVTVTGIFYNNDTLVAHAILTKCPSKYEAEITRETFEQ